MKKLLSNRVIIDLLIIFFLSLTPLLWFRSGQMMLGHDNVFPLEPKLFLLGRLTTWSTHAFGQSQSLIMGTIPIHLIDAIPYFLGFSLIATQKIVYVFWFFMIGVAMYTLAKTIQKDDRFYGILAAVFYQFNFFILQGWFIGERTKFSAYIAMPLILALFIRVYSSQIQVLTAAVLASLFFFVFNGGGLYGIPLFGGFFIAVGVLLAYSLFISFTKKDFSNFVRLLTVVILSIAGYIAVNSYFLLPAFKQAGSQFTAGITTSGGISGLIDWASEISANTSITNLMRMQGIAEWYDNPEHPYAKIYLTNPVLIVLSFVWPLMVLIALILAKKKMLVVYLFLVYLIGLLFAGGTHPPFGFFYTALLKYIPGFVIFRSPYYKFAPAIFLSASLLTASLLWHVKGIRKYIFFIGFTLIVLFYHFPYFTGNFFSWKKGFSTRLAIPDYILNFGNWLNERSPEEGRILLLPPNDPALSYSQYTWGYLSFQSLPTLLSNYPVVVNNDRLTNGERRLVQKLYESLQNRDTEKSQMFFSLLGIKYLVLQEDFSSVAVSQNDQVQKYQIVLQDPLFFESVKTFGKWTVYKIKNPTQPLVYLVDKVAAVEANKAEQNIEDFVQKDNVFVRRDSSQKVTEEDFSGISTTIIVPTCINCPLKNKPLIQFPERNILPDSPLYILVTLLENRRINRTADPKSQIYAKLGLTLKRISEINEMIIRRTSLRQSVVDAYLTLLSDIQKNLEKINLLKDKLEVASDIRQYLKAERDYLNPNLGIYLTRGEQTVKVGKIYSGISQLEKYLEPLALQYESSSDRVYQFTVDNEGSYDLFIRTQDFVSVSDLDKVRFRFDDLTFKNLSDFSSKREQTWINLGQFRANQGTHYLTLEIPDKDWIVYDLQKIFTDVSVAGSNECFGSTLTNLSAGKLYRLVANYINDFSENLHYYKWEIRGLERRLIDATRLYTSGLPDKKDEILEMSPGVDAVAIAFCAPNLTAEIVKKQISLFLGEVIYPSVFLRPTVSQTPKIYPAQVRTISTTRYEINLPEMINPSVLIFPQRFDDLWELTGSDKHIKVNGYANGWLLPANPSTTMILEYRPQKYFILGSLISLSTVAGGILFLWFKRKRKSS